MINAIRFTDVMRPGMMPSQKPKEGKVSDHATTLTFSRPRRFMRARYSVMQRLALMYEAWRSRRILAELDPRLLKDIGISRAEAQAEITRALWDFELRR